MNTWRDSLVLAAIVVGSLGIVLVALRWWFYLAYIKPAQEENERLRARVREHLDMGTSIVRKGDRHG